MKTKICQDCGNEIKHPDAKRCNHCAKLGELSPVYKGYDKLFTKELLEKEYETQSVCDIAKKFKVPQSCVYRIFEKFNIKRRKCNSSGLLASTFKHLKCSRFIKKCCELCGAKLSTNPNATICSSCSGKLRWTKPGYREKMSQKIKEAYIKDPNYRLNRSGKNSSAFGKIRHGKGSYYQNFWMRSSYEIAFATWCDKNNIVWQYEPKTFDLGNTTYTPDFYLPEFNLYIEIKGWWRDDAKIKFDLFKQMYCGERIKIVDKNELQSIGVIK